MTPQPHAAVLLAGLLLAGCGTQTEARPTAGMPTPSLVAAPVATTAPTAGPTATPTLRQTTSPRPTPSPVPSDEVAGMLKALADGRTPERLDAVTFLATSTDARVQAALENAVADRNLEVRTAVAIVLGHRAAKSAVKPIAAALAKELATPDSIFIGAASTALGQLGGPDGVPVLIDVLVDGGRAGRAAATKAIGAIGAKALPALREALVARDVMRRVAAVTGLAALGGDGVKPLIRALKDKAVEVRTSAANKLGYLGDRSAESGLVALFGNPERKTASIALARLYEREPLGLTHYLRSRKTLLVYHGLIYIGAETTVDALVDSLLSVGDLDMATEFLNCGNEELEAAAERWAAANGYVVVPDVGGAKTTWGTGLPE